MDYPVLLDFPQAQIYAYPPETVVAEKLQAMVFLGMQNSRMKDFYDLWFMAQEMRFEGDMLVQAIRATFKRRGTSVPEAAPVAFSNAFFDERDKVIQWEAFLRRSGLDGAPQVFSDVVGRLSEFLIPPLAAAFKNEGFKKSWDCCNGWG